MQLGVVYNILVCYIDGIGLLCLHELFVLGFERFYLFLKSSDDKARLLQCFLLSLQLSLDLLEIVVGVSFHLFNKILSFLQFEVKPSYLFFFGHDFLIRAFEFFVHLLHVELTYEECTCHSLRSSS